MISKNRHDGSAKTTAKRMLDAAEMLFAHSGFAGTSTRAIAEAAQANIGLISYYFGSKEGVFEAVVSRRGQELGRALNQSIKELNGAQRELHQFLAVSAEFLLNDHPAFLILANRELLSSEATSLSEIVENHLAPHRQMLESIVNGGMADDSFQPVNASIYHAMILGTMAVVAGRSSAISRTEIANVVDLLMAAILNPSVQQNVPDAPALLVEPAVASLESSPPTDQDDDDPFGIGIFD